MASALERDNVVILRMDGEDLEQFVSGTRFEEEAKIIYSEHIKDHSVLTLRDCISKALLNLTVDHGMPPPLDPWVVSNIVQPALMQLLNEESAGVRLQELEAPISQEIFLKAFRKVLQNVVVRIKVHPVIVAHTGGTFDGNGIRTILSNKPELDRALDSTWASLPKDEEGRLARDSLGVAMDVIAPTFGLPIRGVAAQMDAIRAQVVLETGKGDIEGGSTLDQEGFNKVLPEIMNTIMRRLEVNPVTVFSNAVVNEPI